MALGMALAGGFQATLRKPVDADDIVAAITSLIQGQG